MALRCVVIMVDRDDHTIQVGVSSTISMIIGFMALVACIILVVLLVRCVSCLLRVVSALVLPLTGRTITRDHVYGYKVMSRVRQQLQN